MSDIDIPTHLGLILDGNRRWAKFNQLPSLEGHKKGYDNLTTIARKAFRKGIRYVSAYIFSTENWSRSQREVNYLMNLAAKLLDSYLDELHREGIRVIVLGRRDGLRAKVLSAIQRVEEKTKDNTNGMLALCFNYGGKEELVDVYKRLLADGVNGATLNSKQLAGYLYGPEVPDVDLLIRTSGEHRLSGYMLYRMAYAELYFTNTYWPAFSEEDLDEAIEWYGKRDRRFGK